MEKNQFVSELVAKQRQKRLLLQHKILEVLRSNIFRVCIGILIFIDLAAVILQSFASMNDYSGWFYLISFVSGFVFTIEYLLRVFSAPAAFPELSPLKARIHYIRSFLGIIDLISIAPFTVAYFFQGRIVKDMIELARILLIFKLLRYSQSYGMVKDVMKSVRYEMITAMTFSSLIVCFSAILMYYIERDAQPHAFDNVGQGFWWAIITFTTVGYGDIVPITPLGKLLASFIALVGIITLMLPTGIISGALMNRIQEETRQRKDAESQSHQCGPESSGSGEKPKMEQIPQTNNEEIHYECRCPHCGHKLS